jgi:hypothetical protein
MLKAICVGSIAAIILSHGSIEFHEYAATHEAAGRWTIVLSAPVQALAALAPGFAAGWLARHRGILVGFFATLIGNVAYSAMAGTYWNSVLEGGVSNVAYTTLLRSNIWRDTQLSR